VIIFDQQLPKLDEASLSSHLVEFDASMLHILLDDKVKTVVKVEVLTNTAALSLQQITENAQFFCAQPRITLIPALLSNQNLDEEIIALNFSNPASIRSVKSLTEEEKIFFETTPVVEELSKKTVGRLTTIAIPLIHLLKQKEADTLLLAVAGKSLFIGLQQNNKLVLMNGFTCETTDELLYYTMLTVQQYQINPSLIDVICIGDIKETPQLKEKLLDYFLNVEQLSHGSIHDMRYSGFVKLLVR
jgi:hypothetical protein